MMKRSRTTRVAFAVAILWTLAFCGSGYVVLTGLSTKRWPWTGSQEEVRIDGEQVVAALEEYKAKSGEYPKDLYEAGIDFHRPNSNCYYHSRKKGERIHPGSSSVYQTTGYSLTVRSGPDEWVYDSEPKRWEWCSNVGSGG